jgi:hypothetical protein
MTYCRFRHIQGGKKRFRNREGFSQLIEKITRQLIYTVILAVPTKVLIATQLLTASRSYQKSYFERCSYSKFSCIKHRKINLTARSDTLYGYRKIQWNLSSWPPTDVDHISVKPAKSYIVSIYDQLRNISTFICWIPVYVSHAKWNRGTVYTCL